jgi:hypothetical protein
MGLLADGWTKRQTISIQPTTAALAEFTAVLTEAMLPSVVTDVLFDAIDGALTTGGDLRISVDEDGDTLVGLDFRRWDKAAGKIEIAYRVPATSALLITTLYLWWGKEGAEQPAANELGGQHSAYDDDTIFCAPVGGGANRTAYNITGTDVGGITAGDIAAPSGLLGTQHTDVGDYSTYGDNPDLDLVNTDWTMSFLFRATTSGQEQYVLGKYDHTTENRGYLCILSPSQHFDLIYKPERNSYDPIYRISSGVDVVDGQWHHLAGTFISGTRASVYTDGILRNTTTNNIPSSVTSNDASFQIGTQITSQNRPADFSHVTVHIVARSAEWLKAENDNFRDPNSFYDSFPAPVYVSDGSGWSHRVALTISAAYIDEDLTNWTLVFDQSFMSFLTQVDGPLDADGDCPSLNGGGDIRFSSDEAGANRLACDIRDWSTDNTPANATCEVAVKIPSVSSSTDQTIYMWWGKSGETQPAVTDTYGQYNAYDSDYELVYPLSENTGLRFDRTSNQETLTPNSTPTAVDGIVGKANSFDGLDDYLYSGTSNPIEGGNTFTVECWSKAPRSQPNGYTDASIVTLATAGVTSDALGFWCDAASPASGRSNLIAWLVAGERIESDTGQWTDDTWEHFAGTSSSTTLKLLINGVEVTDSPKSVAIGNVRSNTRFLVAAWDFDLDRYERSGEIDELRISSTVRANAWIAANYHNQRNASGFLNFGPIEDIGGQTIQAAAADGLGLADSSLCTAILTAAAADGLGLAENSLRTAILTAAAADSLALAGANQGAGFYSVAGADVIGLTDQASRRAVLLALAADAMGLSDTATSDIVGALVGYAVDSLLLADSGAGKAAFLAAVSEAITINDATAVGKLMAAMVDDALALSDRATLGAGLLVAAADSITFTDDGLAVASFYANATDTITVDDLARAGRTFLAAVADALGISDTAQAINQENLPQGLVKVSMCLKRATIQFLIKSQESDNENC